MSKIQFRPHADLCPVPSSPIFRVVQRAEELAGPDVILKDDEVCRKFDSGSASGRLVLLVEDDSTIQALSKIHLNSFGYDVLLASDGNEALRLASVHPDIQLIILDFVMPGLSGRRLADKASEVLPGVGILFCSGYSPEDLANDGLDVSAGNFLPKPYRAVELKAKIEELLGTAGKPALSAISGASEL